MPNRNNKFSRLFYLFITLGVICSIGCGTEFEPVEPGLDVLVEERLGLIKNKRIGIVTNHTALSADGEHIVDLLNRIPDVGIHALFAPEHGIRGDRAGGEYIETYEDSLTGIAVYSLYHRNRKPTAAMLDSVDILLFDIMDIGARFYTYISTMALAMEAAAEAGIPFIVLDRPNPITGEIVEGPVLKEEHKSFVGMFPIPIRHGLTVGELALMINGQGWLTNGIRADLTVVPVRNWKRLQWFDQTGLPWVKTSPNMPSLEAANLYPGIGLLEGVNVSEGRGTPTPFTLIGSPWMRPGPIKERFTGFRGFGTQLEVREFTPVPVPNAAPHPEFQDRRCRGFYLNVKNRNLFRPVSFAVQLLTVLRELHPRDLEFTSGFDRLAGDSKLQEQLLAGVPANKIIAGWSQELKKFKRMRKKYLLYE
ncbi:MAG: DUF1343 domain-containing protein [bacterium]